MTDLTKLTIAEAREGLKNKDYTSLELTDAFIKNIEAANEKLNAYVTVTTDKARDMAKASDAKLAKGEGGALEGIPLGIKDLSHPGRTHPGLQPHSGRLQTRL